MEKIRANFFRYVSMNVIGGLGISIFILADTYFIAQALGTAGLAALNFSIAIFSLLHGSGLMIGIGGATEFSLQKRGANEKSGSVAFVHSIILGLIVSAVFFTVAVFFTGPLATVLGADEVTSPLTQAYLKTVLGFSPFFVLNNIIIAFVRNDKNPRLSMIAMLIGSFANIILDYVFIFVFAMGMFGAALATGLSPIISLCILSLHFKGNNFRFKIIKCKISLLKMFRIMSLGFSAFIGELALAIALITFNLIIIRLSGNTGVAAYGVIANIALIATAIFVGISQGIQPLASKYYARKDVSAVNQIFKYSILTALAVSAVIYATLYFFSNSIVGAFNSEGNAVLADLAEVGIKIYFIGYVFAGINIVCAAFLSAISNAKQAMVIAILRSAVFLIPFVLLLSSLFGMNGVWVSFLLTEFTVFIIAMVLMYKTPLHA